MSFYEFKITIEVNMTSWCGTKPNIDFDAILKIIDEDPYSLRGSASMSTEKMGMLTVAEEDYES